jgi:RNA polymerase sigma factor (sigma-70 family)
MNSADSTPPGARSFATTRWSLVLAAGAGGSGALAELCRSYWFPLYAFARRLGHSPHDAEDLTQGFFADLLARAGLTSVAAERGRFRSFLLASLKNFLSDQRDRARAQKRGGGQSTVSFDAVAAEERYAMEPPDAAAPELLFDRHWALAVVERALRRLEAEYAGQAVLFTALRPMLTGSAALPSYAEIGGSLGMEEGAVKVAVHRLRKRYAQALRTEIAETVSDPADTDAELRHLLAVLGA